MRVVAKRLLAPSPRQDDPSDEVKLRGEPQLVVKLQAELEKIDYQIWGTKKFNPETGNYDEDENLGSSDMQFSCPRCSVKLDPELVPEF